MCAKCPPSAETHARIFRHFSQTGIFSPNFTRLLYVHIYARIQVFIQLPPTMTKLCHIKCDHPACVSADGWHFEHIMRVKSGLKIPNHLGKMSENFGGGFFDSHCMYGLLSFVFCQSIYIVFHLPLILPCGEKVDSVSQKIPWGFLTFSPKWLGIFCPNFTSLLDVPIYAKLQLLSPTVTKCDHPACFPADGGYFEHYDVMGGTGRP